MRFALLLIGGWLALAPAHAQQPVPALAARVTDLTGTLAPAERDAIERKLAEFEGREGSQIVVLMVATTQPEAIEQYALRVVEAWSLGRASIDDGVLLLVAKDDRRLRIEVGYGLEGAVPDALARRIISERIVPHFYTEDYAAGIDAGIDALIGLVEGEPLPEPEGRTGGGAFDVGAAMPILLVLAAFLGPLFRRLLGALPGALALGAGAGAIAWLVSRALPLSFAVGGIVLLLALMGLGGGARRWSSGGPWGRGRGGFGGGGFRGGGGRFGGGGASGGW